MRILLLANGTRGDVQPAIALGQRLIQEGHHVTILASAPFQAWIESYGLTAIPSAVDVAAVMASTGGQEWVEQGHRPLVQLRTMRALLDQSGWEMIMEAWQASAHADLLISSFTADTYATAIAAKRGLPLFSMPLQPTLISTRDGRSLVNAPLPRQKSVINYLFGKAFIEPAPWQIYGRLTNRFRQEVLGLPPQSAAANTAARRQITMLLAYSRHLVPMPSDWPSHFHAVGPFILNDQQNWQPPPTLTDWLDAGPPPIAIGFGSMIGRNPEHITHLLIEAIRRSNQRAVLLSGWAGLGNLPLPDTIYCLPAAPHSWLFPRMAAVVHHGGAGTTHAGVRAGVPAVIVPHMADQPFWAQRLHALGVSPPPLPRYKLTADRLAAAVQTAVSSTTMRQQAEALGQMVRMENGLDAAAEIIRQHIATGRTGAI